MWNDTGSLHHFAVFPRAAVSYWRFVGIQLHNGVVNAKPGKRRQHVFDRMDPRVPFGKGSRAVGLNNVFHAGLDFWFAFQVHPAKTNSSIGRRGQESHRHPIAAMQTDARETSGAI